MISRRGVLAASLLFAASRAQGQVSGGGRLLQMRDRPLFGAIRWDAWYSNFAGSPGYELATSPGTMAPNTWHFRLPVHVTVGNNTVDFTTYSQSTVDAEIRAANACGLDYWAFLRYSTTAPTLAPMNNAFDLYLTSAISKPRFCVMKQTNNLGSTGNFATQNADTLEMMRKPGYVFVQNNRPLFYIFFGGTQDITNNWGGSYANLKAALDALRASVQAAGFGNPYIVWLDDTGTYSSATAIGADSYGRYVGRIPVGVSTPFATMRTTTEGAWATDAAGYGKLVPTCNVGFDPTPLNQIPPGFWSTNPNTVVEPTNAELVAHFQTASNYVKANRSVCDAGVVLIYAWSECAEGGVAMMPTIGNPTGTKGLALLSVA